MCIRIHVCRPTGMIHVHSNAWIDQAVVELWELRAVKAELESTVPLERERLREQYSEVQSKMQDEAKNAKQSVLELRAQMTELVCMPPCLTCLPDLTCLSACTACLP